MSRQGGCRRSRRGALPGNYNRETHLQRQTASVPIDTLLDLYKHEYPALWLRRFVALCNNPPGPAHTLNRNQRLTTCTRSTAAREDRIHICSTDPGLEHPPLVQDPLCHNSKGTLPLETPHNLGMIPMKGLRWLP